MRITTLIAAAIWLTTLPLYSSSSTKALKSASNSKSLSSSDRILTKAYQRRLSEIKVRCSGVVIRKLSDDVEGIRHQRFIIKLASGQTLLIVHNIDLAPRLATLKRRDRVVVMGEYIWSRQGGLIHLTHLDPDGVGFHGFIRHKGNTYQ